MGSVGLKHQQKEGECWGKRDVCSSSKALFGRGSSVIVALNASVGACTIYLLVGFFLRHLHIC
jgi:hypothetical protein